ncbi:MAG: LysM peptidoglycan-binding domain-containing protein [Lachnospiraceae bacterium]|jgi:hypothetical protein|nr:LysM peptidoglycan-binding domain-containing protein [Lachnospiraceae bacterium]
MNIMNNKVLLSGFITILIISLIGFGSSKDVKAKDIKAEGTSKSSDFVIEDGVLKKYKGSAKEVIIPDGVIEIGGGEAAANNGLNYNDTITSVVIPDTVTKIGVNAFYMCTSLTKIDIPDSVTTIATMAFGSCRNLSEITIPKSVTTIDSKMAFFNTPWLEAKEAESDIVIVNNILISGYNAKGEVIVPEGVTKLAGSSMSFSTITKVTLPESLIEVGKGAFAGCGKLKEVYIKDNVEIIGDGAFERCKSLEVLRLSNKLTEIGDIFSYANGCKNLKELEIPVSVKKIHENTFISCAKTFTILVHENSAAHKYAKENNVRYKVIGADGKIQTPTYKVVKVKKGDTLWKISSKHLGKGNRFKEIIKLNNLKKTTLYVGQKLKLPTK